MFNIRSFGEFGHLIKSSKILKNIIHNVHESGNSLEEKINIEQKHKEFLDNLAVDPVIKVNDLIADEKIFSSRKKVKSDLFDVKEFLTSKTRGFMSFLRLLNRTKLFLTYFLFSFFCIFAIHFMPPSSET